jgi:hypothetical protein
MQTQWIVHASAEKRYWNGFCSAGGASEPSCGATLRPTAAERADPDGLTHGGMT